MDIKLPELPAQLGNLRDTQKIEVMRYAQQAVREALENQEAVAWMSKTGEITKEEWVVEFTKQLGAHVQSLAIIPTKEKQ